MSRIDDGDGPDDTESFLRACAFQGNVRRAVAGKKGRKFFQELEAALLALPEKKLASGVLTRPPRTMMVEGFEVLRFLPDYEPRGEYCALGAVAVKRAIDAGKTKLEALKDLNQVDPDDEDDEFGTYGMGWDKIDEAAAHLKISMPLAFAVVDQNDEGGPHEETPEQRYDRVLSWVRRKLGQVTPCR
jgi:hypothetical protein